jgi:hypothetical protein
MGGFDASVQQLGWIEGRNLQFDYRSSEGIAERGRNFAAELLRTYS